MHTCACYITSNVDPGGQGATPSRRLSRILVCHLKLTENYVFECYLLEGLNVRIVVNYSNIFIKCEMYKIVYFSSNCRNDQFTR